MDNIFEKLAAINPHILEKTAAPYQENANRLRIDYNDFQNQSLDNSQTIRNTVIPAIPATAGGLALAGGVANGIGDIVRNNIPVAGAFSEKSVIAPIVLGGGALGAGLGMHYGAEAAENYIKSKSGNPLYRQLGSAVGGVLGGVGGGIVGAGVPAAILHVAKQASVLAPTLTEKVAAYGLNTPLSQMPWGEVGADISNAFGKVREGANAVINTKVTDAVGSGAKATTEAAKNIAAPVAKKVIENTANGNYSEILNTPGAPALTQGLDDNFVNVGAPPFMQTATEAARHATSKTDLAITGVDDNFTTKGLETIKDKVVDNAPVITGAGIGGVAGAALGNYLAGKNNKALGTALGGLAGAGLGGAAGYYLKQASVLAPTLTEKFAAEEVEARKLPKQNKYDLLYYPDVTQHALAAGLTVGAAPMLGLGVPHPAVGLTTGLGVYAGGKLGRGLGAVAGFPNAGAVAGEVAGGIGGLLAGKHLM